MATSNSVETLNGMFKKVYSSGGLAKIHPNVVKIYTEIDFIEDAKQGGFDYNVPVVLANEHGKL